MTSEERYDRAFHFGPVEHRGLVGSLRLGQVAVLGLAAIAALLVFRTAPNVLGFLTAIALLTISGGIGFGRWRGRTIEQWAPVVWRWLALRRSGVTASARPIRGRVACCANNGTRPRRCRLCWRAAACSACPSPMGIASASSMTRR